MQKGNQEGNQKPEEDTENQFDNLVKMAEDLNESKESKTDLAPVKQTSDKKRTSKNKI